MSNKEKILTEWVAQHLISQEQAAQIKQYEATKHKNSWILSGLLILGAIVFGIGIISLIAANWYKIPYGIKLSINLFSLIFLIPLLSTVWQLKKEILFEGLLVLFLTHISHQAIQDSRIKIYQFF